MDTLSRRTVLAGLAAAAGWPAAGLAAPRDDDAGWRIAADFEPARAVWIGFDPGHLAFTATLVRHLRPHVRVRLLVGDDTRIDEARSALAGQGVSPEGLEFVADPNAGYFMRDLALFASGPGGANAVVDFVWSHYGLASWCQRRHAPDARAATQCTAGIDSASADHLARSLARRMGWPALPSDVALEGGGIENNGQGLLLVSEPYLLHRNPGRTRESLERSLLDLPGVRKVVWLAEGLAQDPPLRATVTGKYVAWGTGGHADQFVRFADPGTVLLAWPDAGDLHPVARLTRQRMARNLRILAAATDADGRPLRLVRMPTPRVIERSVTLEDDVDPAWSEAWSPAYFPESERRKSGQRLKQVAPASYLNFVVANGIVLVPDYLPHGTPTGVQARVQRLFQTAFEGRRIEFIDALSVNWYGGGPHCATLNEPAGLG